MPTNLLTNPSFENGTYPIDNFGSQWVPNGWKISFRPSGSPKQPKQDTPWGEPNLGCINVQQVPEQERTLFFLNGENCWKIWTESSYPFGFTLSQAVTLTPGRRYRFTANVFPDMVVDYSHGKEFASDPDTGAAQLTVNCGSQSFSTGFLNGERAPFGRYTPISLEFTAPAAEAEVAVEAYGIYGLKNNCFFFDDFSLVEIAAPTPKPTPPANNLLINGSFEEGRAYFADEAREQAVPSGWSFEAKDAATPRLPGQTADFGPSAAALVSQHQVEAPNRIGFSCTVRIAGSC